MKSKININYWIDAIIGIALLLSVVSGLVLLSSPAGGHQGGRNPGYGRTVLFLGHHTWGELHNWSSILMAAGVFAHLVLHWNWIVCMTKKLLGGKQKKESKGVACPQITA